MYVFHQFQESDLPDIFAKIKAIFQKAGKDSLWQIAYTFEGPTEGHFISKNWKSEPMAVLLDGYANQGCGLMLSKEWIIIRNEFLCHIKPLEYWGWGLPPQPTWLSISPTEIVYRVKTGIEKDNNRFDWQPPQKNEYPYEIRKASFQGHPYEVVVLENVARITRVK